MKKLKQLITSVFTLCISLGMTMPVFASVNLKDSNLTPSITKNPQNTLGYLIEDQYSNTLYIKNGTSTNVGAINIFGNNDGTWYETSKLADSTPYKLTGLFPVLAVGTNTDIANHTHLKNVNGILKGHKGSDPDSETDSVVMSVTPEFVLENQYVKLSFKVENKTSESKTVSFGAYSDIQVNGKDDATAITGNLGGNGISLLKQGTNTINYILKASSTDTLLKDYVNDVESMWYGNRGTASDDLTTVPPTPGNTEYKYLFTNTVSTSYDTAISGNDSAMTFAWIDETITAGQTITKSILIGAGPIVTLGGNDTYNLDDSADVKLIGKLSDPTLQTGESNQLWYSVNGGTAKKLGEPRTDKYSDYEINVKDDAELKTKCEDNIVKVWVGDPNDSNKIISNVAEHKFKVTTNACSGTQVQTGINISYIIITIILCGGTIAFVYSKKHNKFPQV